MGFGALLSALLAASLAAAPAEQGGGARTRAAGEPATRRAPADNARRGLFGEGTAQTRPAGRPPILSDRLLWRMGSSLLLVAALAVVALWLMRKIGPGFSGVSRGARALRVEQRLPLGQRQSVCLLAVGRRKYLLATGRDQVSLLADVTDAETESDDAT